MTDQTTTDQQINDLADHAVRLRGLLDAKRGTLTAAYPDQAARTEVQIRALEGRCLEIEAFCARYRSAR